jgi:hypothetical protein
MTKFLLATAFVAVAAAPTLAATHRHVTSNDAISAAYDSAKEWTGPVGADGPSAIGTEAYDMASPQARSFIPQRMIDCGALANEQ